jgi:SpoVK/Ycf46/Vps4 family AAA+-type ATPase
LPDEPARAAILRERIAPLPAPIGSADILELAAASQGLTGADLRNVVEDAKLLFAHDRVNSAPPRLPQDYFLEAIETVRVHRRKYAKSKPLVLEEPITVGFTVE